MCGRFENKQVPFEIINVLEEEGYEIIDGTDGKEYPAEDICPTNKIMTIVNTQDKLKLTTTKWGIKFSDKSPLIFNSRIETIKAKKFWTGLFEKKKAVVPMTAFYEWPKVKDKKVQHKIYLKDTPLFYVAAISFEKDEEVCTSLITVPPNEFMEGVHNRMPVIFNLKNAVSYLNNNAEGSLNICISYPDSESMQMEEADLSEYNQKKKVLKLKKEL